MDKYSQLLQGLPFDLLHIAQSYATDNKSPKIEPAHLLRALLHKSAGLVNFIEDTLDEDYYYLVDWTDMRIKQCDKSPYGMKGAELSHDSQMVVKEAMEICEKYGLPEITPISLLASLVTPGVGFTYEQLKTLPLQAEKIVMTFTSDVPVKTQTALKVAGQSTLCAKDTQEYCVPMLLDVPESKVIGFEQEYILYLSLPFILVFSSMLLYPFI